MATSNYEINNYNQQMCVVQLRLGYKERDKPASGLYGIPVCPAAIYI